MSKTNRERVLEWVWAASPHGAGNREIWEGTGIHSQQQVYLLTGELAGAGWIHGERRGRGRAFWTNTSPASLLAAPGELSYAERRDAWLSAQEFSALARKVMMRHLGESLVSAPVGDVPWCFALVSMDDTIAGDVIYLAPSRWQRLPVAKFALISERVWLLQQSGAAVPFLVFGYDRDVPRLWLQRYGPLAGNVAFYFVSDEGDLEQLAGPQAAADTAV